MTLIIACINDQAASVVADRRLSSDQGPSENEATKLTAVFAADSVFAMTYTGFAMLGRGDPAAPMREGRFVTQEWLLHTLSAASGNDPRGEPLIRNLAASANHDFARLAHSDSEALTVVFAGYYYGEQPPRQYVWCVSNFERFATGGTLVRGALGEFVASWARDHRPGADPWHAVSFGADDALDDSSSFAALAPMLHNRWKPASIVDTSLDIIRQAAKVETSIGQSCTSLMIDRDSANAEARYHPAAASAVSYWPHVLDARTGGTIVMHGETWTEQPPWWRPA
jgi:hypothetical protein